MEAVKEWITWFFSLPLPIVGVTVLEVSVFILVFLTKTSFGKKLLNALKDEFHQFVDNYKTAKEISDKEIAKMKEEYEAKIAELNTKIETLDTLIIGIASNIHNSNVKTLLEEHKNEER